MGLILTVPLLADFGEIAKHPAVEAVRVNTTIPIIGTSIEDVLTHLSREARGKDVWVDLKCRQLRITRYFVELQPGIDEHHIYLSRKISVNTPTDIWLDNGNIVGKVSEVRGGNELIVRASKKGEAGLPFPSDTHPGIRPGMSVNIFDSSLKIEGYLTERDKKYVRAGRKMGLHNYMLSFVEQESDITDLFALDPKARIVAKIESPKGLEFVRTVYPKYKQQVHLMLARGDLYQTLERPDQIIDAAGEIIRADQGAIFASRIYESLQDMEKMPNCAELFDVYAAFALGYSRLMIGDEIGTRKNSTLAAIRLYELTLEKFTRLK